jgi:hypothetical protein
MKQIKSQSQRKTLQQEIGHRAAVDDFAYEFFLPRAFTGLKRSRNRSFLRSSSKKSNMAQ